MILMHMTINTKYLNTLSQEYVDVIGSLRFLKVFVADIIDINFFQDSTGIHQALLIFFLS